MGKSDQKAARKASNEALSQGQRDFGRGINEQSNRIYGAGASQVPTGQAVPRGTGGSVAGPGGIMARSDAERAELNRIYGQGGFGGSTQQQYINELGAALPASQAAGGRGGGGGGKAAAAPGTPGGPTYAQVWQELMGKEGGFDPTRLANITDVAGRLRSAESNYTPSREAIAGLMGIGRTGGITDAMRGDINREYLLETERTGGYRPGDVENIRSRANAAAPGFYQNLQENLARSRGMGNFGGPGLDRSGFKMARESAQQQGQMARDTEIDIADAIRSGRIDASKFLSQQGLNLADLQSKNQLAGYGKAGELDISKNQAIQDALAKSAGIDLDTQQQITGARLGASTASAQDARAKQAIGAASSAASAARADANRRWASQMAQEDRFFGAKGLSDTYTAAPQELMFNQNLLRDYRNDLQKAGQSNVNNRIAIGYMPGLGSSIRQGIGIAGDIAKIGGSVMGGLPSLGGRTSIGQIGKVVQP